MTESRLHYAAASELAFFSLQLIAMESRGAKRILNLPFACLTRSNLIQRPVRATGRDSIVILWYASSVTFNVSAFPREFSPFRRTCRNIIPS